MPTFAHYHIKFSPTVTIYFPHRMALLSTRTRALGAQRGGFLGVLDGLTDTQTFANRKRRRVVRSTAAAPLLKQGHCEDAPPVESQRAASESSCAKDSPRLTQAMSSTDAQIITAGGSCEGVEAVSAERMLDDDPATRDEVSWHLVEPLGLPAGLNAHHYKPAFRCACYGREMLPRAPAPTHACARTPPAPGCGRGVPPYVPR